jgi:hypothetical protein
LNFLPRFSFIGLLLLLGLGGLAGCAKPAKYRGLPGGFRLRIEQFDGHGCMTEVFYLEREQDGSWLQIAGPVLDSVTVHGDIAVFYGVSADPAKQGLYAFRADRGVCLLRPLLGLVYSADDEGLQFEVFRREGPLKMSWAEVERILSAGGVGAGSQGDQKPVK